MKKQKVGSGVGFGRRTMAVEQLERRAMLAGNVNVFVDGGGNLFIRGDNADNGVLVSQIGSGRYTVTGFDFGAGSSTATSINGSADGTLTFTGVKGDINIDLKKGNDALGVGNSPDDLEALADGCGFGIGLGSGSGSGSGSGDGSISSSVAEIVVQPVEGRFFAPRNLIINTGDGSDGVAVIADVKNSEVIITGNGNDGIAVGNVSTAESDVNIGGDLVVLTGNGNDDACVSFATIQGLLNVQTGGGNDEVSATEFDAGQVLMVTGNGNDSVNANAFDSDRTVVVDTGSGADSVLLSNFSAGQGFGPNEQRGAGYVTVVTGAGNDEAELTSFEADGVVVDTGGGNDGSPAVRETPITVANATIKHQLTVVTGGGNDLVAITTVQAHDIVVDTGSGNDGTETDPIEVADVTVAGNLTVVTGSGNDQVYLHGGEATSSNIGRTVTVDTGAGNDVVEVIDQIIGRDLNVFLSSGNDDAGIGVSHEVSEGIVQALMEVHHNLLLDAGSGNDSVEVGNLTVSNDLFAFLGAGNDSLSIQGANVSHNALIDAGAGNDTVSIGNSQINNNTTIIMGAGDDTLNIFGSGGNGKLLAIGGPGQDTFNNDLGIESNGTQDDITILEFELFNTED